MESKEHESEYGYEGADGRDCVLRSAQLGSRLVQSLGHRSRMVRACISCLEINWFPFPFPPKKTQNPNECKGQRKGQGVHFSSHLRSGGIGGWRRTIINLAKRQKKLQLGNKGLSI